MPIVERVLSRFGYRKNEPPVIASQPSITVRGGTGVVAPRGVSWGISSDYYSVASQGYQANADAYACISLIAQAAKQVRWWDGRGRAKSAADLLAKQVVGESVYEFRKRMGEKIVLNPIPSLALLNQSGGLAFVEHWTSYVLLSGNAYIEIERNQAQQPAALFLDRPDRVQANPPGTNIPPASRPGRVDQWRIGLYGGAHRDIPPADLIHSRLFNPLDDIYGMAPLTAAMLSVAMQNKGGALMTDMLTQGFSPGWIEATSDKTWDENQLSAMRQHINENRRAHQEIILMDAKWHAMNEGGGAQLDDAVIRQHELTKRDIASVYHVDPALIGDTSSRTYATYRESRYALYMEAVIPLLTMFRDDWNRSIGRELQSPLDFDRDSFDAIAQARAEAADRVTKLFTSGLITQPEARADLEYDPPKTGDVFFATATLTPLDVSGQEPAAADAAAMDE